MWSMTVSHLFQHESVVDVVENRAPQWFGHVIRVGERKLTISDQTEGEEEEDQDWNKSIVLHS